MDLARPQWRIPKTVRAFFSTRAGGVSDSPFSSFNLSTHIGDDEGAVSENRMRLRESLPAPPKWMRQAHTARVLRADDVEPDATVADASYTFSANVVCAVATADCLPVLFCAADGGGVAAAHAGWRGLAAGILENTAATLRAENKNGKLLAWLGPAVGVAHYEVGEEVRAALRQTEADELCFVRAEKAEKKWRADLAKLAARRLRDLDIETTKSGLCTYSDPRRFFSARRDGNRCGRMASLIWTETGADSA